jgi:hypothetical protein
MVEALNKYHPALGELWKEFVAFPYSGTGGMALVMGMLAPYVLNCIWDRDDQDRKARLETGNFLEILLDDAIINKNQLSLTLNSGKVYIGYITSTFDPARDRKFVSIIPTISGYRDPISHRLDLNQQYENAIAAIEARAGGINHLSREDLKIVIPVDSIRSANAFDEDVFRLLNNLKESKHVSHGQLHSSIVSGPVETSGVSYTILGLFFVWLLIPLLLSVLGLFVVSPALCIGVSCVSLVIPTMMGLSLSQSFRYFILYSPAKWLILFRSVSALFIAPLLFRASNEYGRYIPLSDGWFDVLILLFIPILYFTSNRLDSQLKWWILWVWNTLGIIDMIMAFDTIMTWSIVSSKAGIGVAPLSYPLFRCLAVALILVSHMGLYVHLCKSRGQAIKGSRPDSARHRVPMTVGSETSSDPGSATVTPAVV